MKPTKQQRAAQQFSARTERIERQRKQATRHANHKRRLAKAQAEADQLAEAQAAWDADHPHIEIEHYDEADLERNDEVSIVNEYL